MKPILIPTNSTQSKYLDNLIKSIEILKYNNSDTIDKLLENYYGTHENIEMWEVVKKQNNSIWQITDWSPFKFENNGNVITTLNLDGASFRPEEYGVRLNVGFTNNLCYFQIGYEAEIRLERLLIPRIEIEHFK